MKAYSKIWISLIGFQMLLLATNSFAQDWIITVNGDTLNGKIIRRKSKEFKLISTGSEVLQEIPTYSIYKYYYSPEKIWYRLNSINPEALYKPMKEAGNPEIPDTILSLGSQFGGGYIFFLDQSKRHGLIAAPSDIRENLSWGCSHKRVEANELGYGLPNTKKIITDCEEESAATACAKLKTGGYNDWYLPAIDELASLYEGRKYVPGLSVDDYCSSSEYYKGKNDCWAIHFAKEGQRFYYNKGFNYRVRAIRKF